jgi:hypothetical protein
MKLYLALFPNKLVCYIYKVLTKPSSVELPAAVLGFGVDLLGDFCVAGWFLVLSSQPTYGKRYNFKEIM